MTIISFELIDKAKELGVDSLVIKEAEDLVGESVLALTPRSYDRFVRVEMWVNGGFVGDFKKKKMKKVTHENRQVHISEDLIRDFEPLIRSQVYRYRLTGTGTTEDLYQEGVYELCLLYKEVPEMYFKYKEHFSKRLKTRLHQRFCDIARYETHRSKTSTSLDNTEEANSDHLEFVSMNCSVTDSNGIDLSDSSLCSEFEYKVDLKLLQDQIHENLSEFSKKVFNHTYRATEEIIVRWENFLTSKVTKFNGDDWNNYEIKKPNKKTWELFLIHEFCPLLEIGNSFAQCERKVVSANKEIKEIGRIVCK